MTLTSILVQHLLSQDPLCTSTCQGLSLIHLFISCLLSGVNMNLIAANSVVQESIFIFL